MRRRLPVLIALALVAALVVVEVATSGGGSSKGSARRAPALPAEVLTPPRATLASLRGKPAIVNFWASWCGPCRKEAPVLRTLSQRLGARAALVGVDWNDALPGARAFIRRNGWSFPSVRDADGSVGNEYHLNGLPNSFVLDSNGRIVKRLIGPQSVTDFMLALKSVE